MNKKVLIVILIFILAIIGIAYYLPKNNQAQMPSLDIQKEDTENNSVDNPLVGSIAKTNPFNVDINPIRGYKNPFSK